MLYYHVFVEIDGDEKEEHDLSKEELESLVELYHRNKKFMCGGSFVQPSEIETIQIYETQEKLGTFLDGKRRLFTFFMSDELILDEYGKNVTKLFIEHPPRKRRTKKIAKEERKTSREELPIPKEVFEKLPKEIQKIIKGVKLCYNHDHADFCFMGMRKALSTAIHIRFRREEKEEELYGIKEEPYKLTKWIELAKQNKFLSASLAKKLTKEVKVFGDVGSHDYRIDFRKEDVPSIFKLLRLALDRMYYKEEKVPRGIRRKPQKRSTLSPKYTLVGEEFDLPRFQTNLKALDGVSDSEIRYKLIRRIRDQMPDLPYDGLPHDIRKAIIQLLLILRKEVRNEKMRRLCLDIFHVINGRRDDETNARIKELFLSWIEENYQDFTLEEKRYAIDIRQRLYMHNPNFIKELMLDSVNKWFTEEFEHLYKHIEFDRLDLEYVEKFKILLWKLTDEAKKKQSKEKMKRIEKLLTLYVFR